MEWRQRGQLGSYHCLIKGGECEGGGWPTQGREGRVTGTKEKEPGTCEEGEERVWLGMFSFGVAPWTPR